jgi:hypothetical protein
MRAPERRSTSRHIDVEFARSASDCACHVMVVGDTKRCEAAVWHHRIVGERRVSDHHPTWMIVPTAGESWSTDNGRSRTRVTPMRRSRGEDASEHPLSTPPGAADRDRRNAHLVTGSPILRDERSPTYV